MAVYDDQEKDNKSLSPEEIAQKERELGKAYNEPGGDSLYKKDVSEDKHQGLREQSQKLEKEEAQALQDSLRSKFNELGGEEGLYRKEGRKGVRGKIDGLTQRRKRALIGAGGGIIGVALALTGMFGFFNAFKLDHLLSGIDNVAFARVNAVFDRRSDKWLRTYIQLRLAEFTGEIARNSDGSVNFRSDRVDTDNPLTDWYRTLRSNRFEENVLNKHGIYFTAQDTGNGVRYARLQVGSREKLVELGESGRDFMSLSNTERDRIISNIDNVTAELFEGPGADRAMRREIKKVVNDNTHFLQVLKRRHLRKDIQNKVGVREWRFFEKTRNEISDKRNEFKKKMLTRIIPEDTKSGKFLICIFGIGDCPSNSDVNNPENRNGGRASGGALEEGDNNVQVDEEGNAVADPDDPDAPSRGSSGRGTPGSDDIIEAATREASEELADGVGGEAIQRSVRTKIINQILQKFNILTSATGLVNTLDMLARIDKNITSGKLNAMVVVARGVQAAQAYTIYSIMRDQQKSGDITAEELGFVMEGLQGIERSEAYDYYFKDSSSTVSAAASKDTYCSDDYVPQPDDYHYICDSIKIGGKNGANTIENMYDGPAFALFRGVIRAYNSARNSFPGNIIGDLLSTVGNALDSVVSAVVEPIMNALGITDLVEGAIAWLTDKVAVAMGAGPILTGDSAVDPAGLVMNMAGQGAAYTAELNMRSMGAPLANIETEGYLNNLTHAYLSEQEQTKSVYDRYLAMDNPQSMASTSLFSILNTSVSNVVGNLSSSVLKSFGSLFTLFTGKTFAASDSFGAAELAGIDTYAFPQFCVENDPLKTGVLEMTNADELGLLSPSDITWTLLRDEDSFWNKIYENVDENNEDLPTQVYNCAELDQRVQGGLGYTSGYSQDGGLEDGAYSSPADQGSSIDCNNVTGNAKIVCAAQNFMGVRYANRNAGTGNRWSERWGVPIRGNIGQNAQEWIAERESGGGLDSPTDFLECSGYVNVAVYYAFGVDSYSCSAGYLSNPNYTPISVNELQPGDLVIKNNICGNNGHVGIFVEWLPDGRMRTLESSAGNNDDQNEPRSGYYTRAASYYPYAARYTGPGSTP